MPLPQLVVGSGVFLQTDPVPGGSANNYDYTNQDPINGFDLAGTCIGSHASEYACGPVNGPTPLQFALANCAAGGAYGSPADYSACTWVITYEAAHDPAPAKAVLSAPQHYDNGLDGDACLVGAGTGAMGTGVFFETGPIDWIATIGAAIGGCATGMTSSEVAQYKNGSAYDLLNEGNDTYELYRGVRYGR